MFFSKLFKAVVSPSGLKVDAGELFVKTYDFRSFTAIYGNGKWDFIKVGATAKRAMQEIVDEIEKIKDRAGYKKSIDIWYFKLKADSKFKYNIVELSGFESYDYIFGYADYYVDKEYTPAGFEADLETLGYSFKQMKNASLIELSQAEVDTLFKEILSDKPQKVEVIGILLNPDNTLQGYVSDTRYLEFSNPIKTKRGSNLGELASLMKEYTQRQKSGSWSLGLRFYGGKNRPKKNYLKPFEIIFYENGEVKFNGDSSHPIEVNSLIPDELGYYVEAPATEWDYTLRVLGGLHNRAVLTLENGDGGKTLSLKSVSSSHEPKTTSGFEKFGTNIKIPKGEDAVDIVGFEIKYINYGLKYSDAISFQKGKGLPTTDTFCMSDRFICMPVVL